MKAVLLVVVFSAGAAILLILSTPFSGGHGRARVRAEIEALSAALESFKANHGHYPSDPATTDRLNPEKSFSPDSYIGSSAFLYTMLCGGKDGKIYFEPTRNMVITNSTGQIYLVDPHGNSYGYSTANLKHLSFSNTSGLGFFDLWSTKGGKTARDRRNWDKNW